VTRTLPAVGERRQAGPEIWGKRRLDPAEGAARFLPFPLLHGQPRERESARQNGPVAPARNWQDKVESRPLLRSRLGIGR
jgi:hypothetical protein